MGKISDGAGEKGKREPLWVVRKGQVPRKSKRKERGAAIGGIRGKVKREGPRAGEGDRIGAEHRGGGVWTYQGTITHRF